MGPAIPYAEVTNVVEDIVDVYLGLRAGPDELFVDVVRRVGLEPFKDRIYAAH